MPPYPAVFVKQLDLKLLRLMRTRCHSAPVEKSAHLISKSGENGYLWFGIGLAGAAFDGKHRKQWLLASLIGPFAIGLNFLVKLAVRRPRPQLEGLPPLGGAPSSLSFPSAHATASFAAATAMSRIRPEMKLALFGAAAVMAVTRPYLGMHYPSDIAAGAVLGTVLGTAAGNFLESLEEDPDAPYNF
ncbi:MAG: phosphatase PAP2 family protein [Solirubrobacterales bacterium]|nr:phosphatase PAP2 family protein [Solirubrobacterales bacterium]